MTSGLAAILVLVIGFFATSAVIAVVVWRVTRGISSRWRRLLSRAFALAFLLAPAAVGCGGVAIVPFAVAAVSDVVGLFVPNDCGPYAPGNLISFLPALAAAVIALYVFERRPFAIGGRK